MKIVNQQLPWTLILAPNETKRLNYPGSYVAVQDNTTTVDPIVCVDSGASFAVQAGTGFPTVQFNADQTSLIPAVFHYVEFTNPSDTEIMTINVLIPLGGIDDTRSVVKGYLQMDLSAPSLATSAALTVETNAFSILPANALVKERIVQNNGDFPVWWGDSDTDPATKRGLCINPGGAAVVNCWGAVYFKAEEAASVLSVVNVLKVA